MIKGLKLVTLLSVVFLEKIFALQIVDKDILRTISSVSVSSNVRSPLPGEMDLSREERRYRR